MAAKTKTSAAPGSAEKAPIWDRIRCPDCHGELLAGPDRWTCTSCQAGYESQQGIPRLIGQKSTLNLSEVAVQDDVSDLYDGVRYKREWSRAYHEHTLEQLVAIAAPHGDVLDDGTGTGLLMEYLRAHAPAVTRFVGIDVSRGMLDKAAQQRSTAPGREILLQADSCRLPFADASFDTVFVRALLHHLPEPADGVREVARVLRPGGTAVILEPNKNLLSTLPRYLARKTSHFDDDHKNFPASYLEKLVSSALTIDKMNFFGYVAYPLLGFPDLASFDRFLPIAKLAPWLTRLDDALSNVPGVRRMSWGVVVRATKPATP